MAILFGFLGSLFAFFAVWAIVARSEVITISHSPSTSGSGPWWRWALLLLLMSVIEEGIFRWFIIGQGRHIIALGPAFVVSLILFTIAHRQNGSLTFLTTVNLILVGLILGVIYLWWGIWTAIAAHFGWNLAEWVTGFTVSGEKTRSLLPAPIERRIASYPYGPESHWSATLIMMLCLSILIFPGLSRLAG